MCYHFPKVLTVAETAHKFCTFLQAQCTEQVCIDAKFHRTFSRIVFAHV